MRSLLISRASTDFWTKGLAIGECEQEQVLTPFRPIRVVPLRPGPARGSHVSLQTMPAIARLPTPRSGSRYKYRFESLASARVFSPRRLPEIPCVCRLDMYLPRLL